MSSTINASTASGGGVITTADASGILQLQTAGVTGLTIDASQNVTLAKGLTVGASAAPAFSAYQSSAQTLTSNVTTKILFQTEEFDTNSNFASSTFTPTVAGYYQVSCSIDAGASTAATRVLPSIYKNGSGYTEYTRINATNGVINGSGIVYLNGTTDYIGAYWYSANGTCTLVGNNGSFFSNFSAVLVSGT